MQIGLSYQANCKNKNKLAFKLVVLISPCVMLKKGYGFCGRSVTSFELIMTLTNKEMYDWWDGAAKCNALTAILSSKERWDIDEFFKSGEPWLEGCIALANLANVKLGGEIALDFGCGVGRMTRALLKLYKRAIGIDISDEMIRLARSYANSLPLEFLQVAQAPLPLADRSVDLSYSTIVIQHIPSPHNLIIVDELFRVSRKVVLFDAPSHQLHPDGPQPGNGIFLLDIADVRRTAAARGFELIGLLNFPVTATRHYQYLFMTD